MQKWKNKTRPVHFPLNREILDSHFSSVICSNQNRHYKKYGLTRQAPDKTNHSLSQREPTCLKTPLRIRMSEKKILCVCGYHRQYGQTEPQKIATAYPT